MTNNSPDYDLAIIGGGIAGTAIAAEASGRGLRVILFEKNKLGSGTSSKSSKLIHGGLRYLETAWSALLRFDFKEFWKNIRFVFLALRETHALAKQWPGLIQDIQLLMPVYKNQGRSRWAVFFGTWLYGILSLLAGGKHGTRLLFNPHAALSLEHGLEKKGLLGAVIVWDHTTDDLALVQNLAAQARQQGAAIFENITVKTYSKIQPDSGYEISTSTGAYRAKRVINASGAWVDQLRKASTNQNSEMIVPIAGAHIETPIFSSHSCILQAADGRIFFVINRNDRARIGTTERLEINPDEVRATDAEINYLLEGIRLFFPASAPSRENILLTDAGIRPLAKPSHPTEPNQISREHQFVRDETGAIHVLGVKLTDHRRAARELLKEIL